MLNETKPGFIIATCAPTATCTGAGDSTSAAANAAKHTNTPLDTIKLSDEILKSFIL